MAQIEQSDNGKKKKGAQKKMQIHVDFTPMVDMNMLLITFFMLCTTMIKSQTLQIALPTNEKLEQEQQNKTKQSEAVTLILDTERDANGFVKTEFDETTGREYPKHIVYYSEGKPEMADEDKDGFVDNPNIKVEHF
ncbi:MAG: biopolymer transporter ExbD, partial [Muribaculaceae bacterium]|nr:biopolymer transporter ExbD [Muribaculaceae bacterium]